MRLFLRVFYPIRLMQTDAEQGGGQSFSQSFLKENRETLRKKYTRKGDFLKIRAELAPLGGK